MINGKENPVEWALLSYELDEVIEHLQEISNSITPESEIDETEFKVYIGHVYAHINRIWNQRNHTGDITDQQFEEFSKFPNDIEPVG